MDPKGPPATAVAMKARLIGEGVGRGKTLGYLRKMTSPSYMKRTRQG